MRNNSYLWEDFENDVPKSKFKKKQDQKDAKKFVRNKIYKRAKITLSILHSTKNKPTKEYRKTKHDDINI